MKQPLFESDKIPLFGEWPTYQAGPSIQAMPPMMLCRDEAKTHDIKLRVVRNFDSRLPVEERAKAWIESRPHVEALFERFAMEAIGAGRKKIGAKALMERIRWESYITKDGSFKCNNIAVALLARRFMAKWPQYGKVFETREKA